MNGLALVIGNANYSLQKNQLANAVNDAKDVSDKLLRLGFNVIKKTDCTQEKFDTATQEFQEQLINYEVGLFYYCGHGLQIEGVNYLTSIDSNLVDEYSAKRNTMTLDELITRMHQSKVRTKIIVLDACRNNPLSKTRGVFHPGLAPIHAPKGTIIAFSTSPGETAGGGAGGRNSVYTAAFLNHIDAPDITIEEFFKRVRHSVYALSNEKQTTWEHTSLIGDFSFNSGQLIHSIGLPYNEEHITDSKFISSGSKFDEIISDLKSYVYTTQNAAILRLRKIKANEINISDQFHQVEIFFRFHAMNLMMLTEY